MNWRRFLRPRGAQVTTHVAEHGGAVARTERAAAEAAMDQGTRAKGAGLPDTTAPKDRAPTTTTTINPERVTAEASTTGRRVDINPAVKPLAYGAAGAATLAALGYAADKVGDAVYHAGEEQLPYTQPLPGGGLLYTDPITGETFVIVAKEGGATHEDPEGASSDPNAHGGTGGGYDIVPVTPGNRA
ncbi:MAG: hypothetical protein WDA16_05940, partial [Candidatus Thermoplasmatota archaeon]